MASASRRRRLSCQARSVSSGTPGNAMASSSLARTQSSRSRLTMSVPTSRRCVSAAARESRGWRRIAGSSARASSDTAAASGRRDAVEQPQGDVGPELDLQPMADGVDPPNTIAVGRRPPRPRRGSTGRPLHRPGWRPCRRRSSRRRPLGRRCESARLRRSVSRSPSHSTYPMKRRLRAYPMNGMSTEPPVDRSHGPVGRLCVSGGYPATAQRSTHT